MRDSRPASELTGLCHFGVTTPHGWNWPHRIVSLPWTNPLTQSDLQGPVQGNRAGYGGTC